MDNIRKVETSNKNNKIMVVVILLAIVFAGIAVFLGRMWLYPQKTTIYVFKDNYKAGQEISESILAPMQVDSSVVLAGNKDKASEVFVTSANKLEYIDQNKNALRMDVAKGMPLMQSMLSVDGGSYIEMTMDDKKVAVTVPVSSVSGVTNDLKAGSRVNIYAAGYGVAGENQAAGTTLIFENMRVLSVTKNDRGVLESATIEVSTDESLKLIDAANTTSLYFGLVNGSGYQASGEDDLHYSPTSVTPATSSGKDESAQKDIEQSAAEQAVQEASGNFSLEDEAAPAEN